MAEENKAQEHKPQENKPQENKTEEKEADQKKAAAPSVADVIDVFVQEIDSLAETLPLTARAISASVKGADSSYLQFLEQHGTNRREEDKFITWDVSAENKEKAERLRLRLDRTRIAARIVPRSFLVSLVSQYDSFLGRLLKAPVLCSARDAQCLGTNAHI